MTVAASREHGPFVMCDIYTGITNQDTYIKTWSLESVIYRDWIGTELCGTLFVTLLVGFHPSTYLTNFLFKITLMIRTIIYFLGATAPSGSRRAHHRGFTTTLRSTTLGRVPPEE
jgi:hypothetical protein